MTPFGPDITDYISFANSMQTVILGNNVTHCKVLGRGTVTRWVETSPKQHRQIILKNILHVEGIKQRFLSTIQFQDNDYVISLERTCTVFHRNGKRLFSAPRHDRAIELILYSERLLKSYSLNIMIFAGFLPFSF